MNCFQNHQIKEEHTKALTQQTIPKKYYVFKRRAHLFLHYLPPQTENVLTTFSLTASEEIVNTIHKRINIFIRTHIPIFLIRQQVILTQFRKSHTNYWKIAIAYIMQLFRLKNNILVGVLGGLRARKNNSTAMTCTTALLQQTGLSINHKISIKGQLLILSHSALVSVFPNALFLFCFRTSCTPQNIANSLPSILGSTLIYLPQVFCVDSV